MAFSTPFSELTRLVESLERSGVDLHRVGADGDELVVDGILSVTVEFGLSLCDAVDANPATVEARDGSVDADGRLSVDLSVATSLLPPDIAAWTTGAEATVSDGDLLVAVPVEIPVDSVEAGSATLPGGAVGTDPARDAGDVAVAGDAGAARGASTGGSAGASSATTTVDGPGEPDGDETADGSASGSAGGAGPADRRVPPFRDHDLLRSVYDSCDTFAEMTEAIGMDVTAETVRRYMIDAGIHEPASYDTGSTDDADRGADEDDPDGPAAGEDGPAGGDDASVDAPADPPEEAIYADGIGLPDGVTVEGLIDAITISNTLYEVSHALGLERGRARDVLAELNLLDLVVGRLAMEAEREVSSEEVVARLRAAADGR